MRTLTQAESTLLNASLSDEIVQAVKARSHELEHLFPSVLRSRECICNELTLFPNGRRAAMAVLYELHNLFRVRLMRSPVGSELTEGALALVNAAAGVGNGSAIPLRFGGHF